MNSETCVTIEVVVARFAENLDWLSHKIPPRATHSLSSSAESSITWKKTVYNKGTDVISISLSEDTRVVSLENVGREAHSYLTHIVENYETLADVTVFLPGSCMDAAKKEKTEKLLKNIIESRNTYFSGQYLPDVRRDLYSFSISAWTGSNTMNQAVNPSKQCEPAIYRPYGKWFEHYFDKVNISTVCWQSIFAVSKLHIHQHSVDHYRKLLECLSSHPNPEEGHYMERSWLAVFHPVPDECIQSTKLYNKPTILRAKPVFEKKSSFADMLNSFKSKNSSTSKNTNPIVESP